MAEENANNFEIYRVQLPTGKKLWVGVISGFIYVCEKDEKMAMLLDFFGFGVLTDLGPCMSLEQFLSFAKQHPILKQMEDWPKFGLSQDGKSNDTDCNEPVHSLVLDFEKRNAKLIIRKKKVSE